MAPFKIGTHVSIKNGLLLPNGLVAHNWVGKILNHFPEFDSYLVQLDATTLQELSDEFLEDVIRRSYSPFTQTFTTLDLEETKHRDSNETYEQSCQQLLQRIDDLQEKQIQTYEENSKNWIAAFLQTEEFQQYPLEQQDLAKELLPLLMNLLLEYEHAYPKEWKPFKIAAFCMNIFPNQIDLDRDFAPFVAPVLQGFVQYLAQEKGLEEVQPVAQMLSLIKQELTQRIIEPETELWDLAQSIVEGSDADLMDWGPKTVNDIDLIMGGIPREK